MSLKSPTRDEIVAQERAIERSEIWVLKQVEEAKDGGWYIDAESGMGTHMKEAPRPPVVGDQIRVWGVFGSPVKGMDMLIDGQWVPCWWKTDEEQRMAHAKWVADYHKRQVEDYEKQKPELDRLFDELPAPLQRRIQRFRDEDPKFRWEGEAYEMAACAEAGRLYKRALDPEFGKALKAAGVKAPTEEAKKKRDFERKEDDYTTDWEDTPENRLWAFDAINSVGNGYKYKKMRELMPEMDDGHSGNTWGHAFAFAMRLLRGEGDKL